ncbi:energy transducer TonB [Ruegeria marisrubri]|uniref:Energy transducer TonB n=1 Tax=Ruegeria marisrubri TaxID=1685379 RepID=A0A0X3TXP3_9RHOB|nr:energy transducer TonB [Ruegeria marisrubri]KUJ80429.1 energy transducer TonB [Ruegeria marisrubri]
MDTGTKISAIAHVTLIGWALIGGTFRSEPLPFEVQDVSVISAEEYAALFAPKPAPEVSDTPATLDEPPKQEDEAAVPEQTEVEQPRPETIAPSEPETEELPEAVVETPDPDVVEEVPALDQPEPDIAALPVPPGAKPKPRPAEKVAPQPVAPPPPEVKPDDVETPPVSTEQGAETPREEQEQTAPEEATDQIVTEAEQSNELAPDRSPRPPAQRPRRPEPAQTAEAEEAKPATDDAVRDALAEALGEAQNEQPAPSGPPLTGGEKDALRIAVSNCWNVGSLSTEALKTTVVVAVAMNRDGTPVIDSIRMVDSSGGSSGAAQQAFGAARRAIIRCGAKGYNLPADKYGQWQNIEMTFNPERMRIK